MLAIPFEEAPPREDEPDLDEDEPDLDEEEPLRPLLFDAPLLAIPRLDDDLLPVLDEPVEPPALLAEDLLAIFLGAAFLEAIFLGAAFLEAAFLGAAFFAAVFLEAAFLEADEDDFDAPPLEDLDALLFDAPPLLEEEPPLLEVEEPLEDEPPRAEDFEDAPFEEEDLPPELLLAAFLGAAFLVDFAILMGF